MKVDQSPILIIIACLNDCSAKGPIINPIISGVGEKFNLLKQKPINPKINNINKSKDDRETEYTLAVHITIMPV
jgi:hypothetical protein